MLAETFGLLEGWSVLNEMSMSSGSFEITVFLLIGDFKLLAKESCLSNLTSSSDSSVLESNWVGSSSGLKFLDFQLVRTNPLAFSKLVAKFRCSFRL